MSKPYEIDMWRDNKTESNYIKIRWWDHIERIKWGFILAIPARVSPRELDLIKMNQIIFEALAEPIPEGTEYRAYNLEQYKKVLDQLGEDSDT